MTSSKVGINSTSFHSTIIIKQILRTQTGTSLLSTKRICFSAGICSKTCKRSCTSWRQWHQWPRLKNQSTVSFTVEIWDMCSTAASCGENAGPFQYATIIYNYPNEGMNLANATEFKAAKTVSQPVWKRCYTVAVKTPDHESRSETAIAQAMSSPVMRMITTSTWSDTKKITKNRVVCETCSGYDATHKFCQFFHLFGSSWGCTARQNVTCWYQASNIPKGLHKKKNDKNASRSECEAPLCLKAREA